jgi:hypothetical protein
MREVDIAFYEYLEADWWHEYHRQREIALAAVLRLHESINDIRELIGVERKAYGRQE